MKELWMIGGPMGVGKTAVCRQLQAAEGRSIFVDGDWCWDMRPFVVDDQTKELAFANMAALLNNDLACGELDEVIFCWVMHQPEIWQRLESSLHTTGCRVHRVCLVCQPRELEQRLQKDIDAGLRTPDVIPRALDRLESCRSLPVALVDTTGLSAAQVAQRLRQMARQKLV